MTTKSSPIQRGDLVLLVRGHHCLLKQHAGIPLRVASIGKAPQGIYCTDCNALGIEAPCLYATFYDKPWNVPLPWLLKIEPPAASLGNATRKKLGLPRKIFADPLLFP